MYFKNKTFNSPRVIFLFLPNIRGLNKITKNVKSTNQKKS